MSKAAQRVAWHAELVGLGMNSQEAANAVNQSNFKAARNAYEHARGVYTRHQQQARATPPPPPPQPVARNTNPRRLSDNNQDGSNLRIRKKSRKRRQELSKGTGQLRINPTQSTNVSTAGQAAQSGGINI